MTILVDIHERRSAVPRELRALGLDVTLEPLAVGDYRMQNGIVVERKTIADLHRSIASARLWRQVGDLARERRGFLLVEGPALHAGRIAPDGVRGALLSVLDNGVGVLRTYGPADSAAWLGLLARRDSRTGPLLGRRSRRRASPTALGVLATVPGISPTTAACLLARFGSIAAIAHASRRQLEEVEGIGPERATTLHRVLGTLREAQSARPHAPPSRSDSPEVPASPARIGRSRGT